MIRSFSILPFFQKRNSVHTLFSIQLRERSTARCQRSISAAQAASARWGRNTHWLRRSAAS